MDTKPEHFADGLHFPECPRWHDGALWVSDMWAHTVLRFEPDGSRHAVHAFGEDEEPGGLGWLPDGRLVVVGMEGRRLYRLDEGTATLYADLSGLAPWSLNDMVVTGDGNAYVSQIGFDIHGGSTPLAPTTLLRVTPGGEPLVAAEEMVVPNGIALSGDGGTMVVAETFAARLSRFRVEADGSLTERQVFAEIAPVAGRRRAGPDGICLDEAGGAWVAEWIGRRVLRVEAGGAVTDEISFDVHPLAVALGGPDRRQLFICLCAQIGKRDRKPEPLGAIAVLPVDIPGAGEP